MKVVILAGGFGSRLSEYTESIPKPMVPIGERTKTYYFPYYEILFLFWT